MKALWMIAALGALLLPEIGMAQQATIPLVTTTPNASGGSDYALGIQILLVMTVLTLLPAMLITMTSFTRVLIVLAILRQAMGTAQTPSNQNYSGPVPVPVAVHHGAGLRRGMDHGAEAVPRRRGGFCRGP